MIFNPSRTFAILPVKFEDGRSIWLDWYYAYAHGGLREVTGDLFTWSKSNDTNIPTFDYYLDKSDDHINFMSYNGIVWLHVEGDELQQLKSELRINGILEY